MQTVRASFTVPGKVGVAAAVQNDPFEPDERTGREDRQMRYVNKSALVMKEQSAFEEISTEVGVTASVKEVQNPELDFIDSSKRAKDATVTTAIPEDIIPGVNEQHIGHDNELQIENDVRMETMRPVAHARLAKFFVDQNEPKRFFNGETPQLNSQSKL